MKKLTPKQKAFAEHYVKEGNATKAAELAGYSDRTARSMGSENLTKPDISEYIAELMQPTEKARIASAKDIAEFLSSVMWGDVKDQCGQDASLTDRIKAAVELLKRYDAGKFGAIANKREDDPISRALKEEAARLDDGNI